VEEARTVLRRLERIEALQRSEAPAGALLAEVRQLLREGEAWIAAEHGAAGPAGAAAAALEDCRSTLVQREEVRPQVAATTTL
jgi:hypothetical protein